MTDWTPEQRRILQHPPNRHGRVFAGPGTGKSTTVLTLAENLQAHLGHDAVRVITFTRAATAELALKAAEDGTALEPVTVHSFALSLLMGHPGLAGLPEPLRIPDSWESKMLIRPDLANRIKGSGHKADVRTVGQLEREMAAQWEALKPGLQLLSDIEPQLRGRYLSVWGQQRRVFGYSMFAEMPLYAKEVLEDHPLLDLHGLAFLIVDEYQDLNRCEIGMLQALAAHDVRIFSVGDDDQSIYGFRMADPAGIREFPAHFAGARDHQLSVSHRCGSEILTAANSLISATPGRPPKPPLNPGPDNPAGEFRYLAFSNHRSEAAGVATLCRYLIRDVGLRASDILIMMRGDFNAVWSTPLRFELAEAGIPSSDVEEALSPLSEEAARVAIALGRIAAYPSDDLAWWTLLRLERGVSRDFETLVADEASARGQRFSDRLRRIADDPPAGSTRRSLNAAVSIVERASQILDRVDLEKVPADSAGWAPWLIEAAAGFGSPASIEFRDLALAVGEVTPQEEGLAHFLNQLEPVTKDIALQADGVAIMTMTRSKGLTYRAAIVMGVEKGVVPSPRNKDVDEERRLLYVAMTRPKEHLYLTMATRRVGPTARSGEPSVGASRSRCPFFRGTAISPIGGEEYVEAL